MEIFTVITQLLWRDGWFRALEPPWLDSWVISYHRVSCQLSLGCELKEQQKIGRKQRVALAWLRPMSSNLTKRSTKEKVECYGDVVKREWKGAEKSITNLEILKSKNIKNADEKEIPFPFDALIYHFQHVFEKGRIQRHSSRVTGCLCLLDSQRAENLLASQYHWFLRQSIV